MSVDEPTSEMPTELDDTESVEQAISILRESVDLIDRIEEEDLEHLPDHTVANLRTAMKDVEDAASEARRGEVESVLKRRVEKHGDTVGDLTYYEQSRVKIEDKAELIRFLRELGIDPKRAMRPNATEAAELAQQEGLDEEDLHLSRYTRWHFQNRS